LIECAAACFLGIVVFVVVAVAVEIVFVGAGVCVFLVCLAVNELVVLLLDGALK